MERMQRREEDPSQPDAPRAPFTPSDATREGTRTALLNALTKSQACEGMGAEFLGQLAEYIEARSAQRATSSSGYRNANHAVTQGCDGCVHTHTDTNTHKHTTHRQAGRQKLHMRLQRTSHVCVYVCVHAAASLKQ